MNTPAARDEFLAVMRHWEQEPAHVMQVANLALQLFDGLQPLHNLGPHERMLLDAAAHLHDTGWTTADRGKEHHKESAKIIRRHPWQQFTPDEVRVMAQVARYHRKSLPGPEHEEFTALKPLEQMLVETLAAMLRVADALDRSHDARVARITPQILADRIILHLQNTAPLERELAAGDKKADLARKVFRREIVFQLPAETGVQAVIRGQNTG